MSERTKKRPSWLSGEDSPTEEPAFRAPGRKGPLAEPDANELRTARESSTAGPRVAGAGDDPVTRVSAPGARTAGTAPRDMMGHVYTSPGLAALALATLLVLVLVSYFLFFRGEEQPASEEGDGTQQSAENPFAGGPARDSGVLFGALQEESGKAKLDGAGLNWSGTVIKKEGKAGETVTLEGPTAAQLERGFDLGSSSVETGVYAVAQDSGEVLHVTTHTFLPEEEGDEAQGLTLGTVYSLGEGELEGYAYYLDQRENGSNEITRTYVRPGAESYSVSYEAEPGTFVPLLIGWRGFGDEAGGVGGGG